MSYDAADLKPLSTLSPLVSNKGKEEPLYSARI